MRTLCSHSALLALAIACGPEPVDDDGDGVPKGRDCDDAVATVYPGAEERCDGIDNDCDGDVDNVSADLLEGDPENCGTCGETCPAENPSVVVSVNPTSAPRASARSAAGT